MGGTDYAFLVKRNKSRENRMKCSATMRKKWQDPEYRAAALRYTRDVHSRPEFIERIRRAGTGRRTSLETKCKIANSIRNMHANNPSYHKSVASRLSARNASSENKRKVGAKNRLRWKNDANYRHKVLKRRTPTSFEQKLIDLIAEYGLPYKYVGDGTLLIGQFNPDFINCNGCKVLVEVYSTFFKLRNYKTIDQYKEERSKYFLEFGFTTVFIDESDLRHKNWKNRCLNKLSIQEVRCGIT